MEVQKAKEKEQAAKVQAPPPSPNAPQPLIEASSGPVLGQGPTQISVVGSYRFQNRLVPDAPAFLRDEGKVGMIVQKEEASNSWVWIGGQTLAAQIADLAKSYDVEQIEMDLEFVLVLLSTDKLKARGVSIFYQQNASWLDVLSLTGDAGSLRISSGGWGAELSFTDSDSGLSLLSQPVIRCLDGSPWSFANDSEVPVPRSELVEGVIRQSIDFRPSGFGLDGTVRLVGDKILLQVVQRNGSITPATASTSEVPIFNNQKLQTTVTLGWWEWTVLGGIQIDREQMRKGIFRNSVQSTSDYLVIFVRPRLALDAPPEAVPVDSNSEEHPLTDDDGLLPPKDWQREERAFIRGKGGK